MATLIDIGLLNILTPAFVFLFIYGLLFALLEKTKPFGDNRGLNALIAVLIAFLFILSPDLIGIIKIMTPWFVVLFVFIIMIVLLFLFVGIKSETVAGAFEDQGMFWAILVVSFLILIFALTQVYGEQVSQLYAGESVDEPTGVTNIIGRIVFHPRVLGALVLILIAAQAIRFISNKVEEP